MAQPSNTLPAYTHIYPTEFEPPRRRHTPKPDMSRGHPMSMEAAIDEERRGVVAQLELEKTAKAARKQQRTNLGVGPSFDRATSPLSSRAPLRSMLDIDEEYTQWHSEQITKAEKSEAEAAARAAAALDDVGSPHRPKRILLDVDCLTPQGTRSALNSPVERKHSTGDIPPPSLRTSLHPRSKSDAASRPANIGARGSETESMADKLSEYHFSNPRDTHLSPYNGKRASVGERSKFAESHLITRAKSPAPRATLASPVSRQLVLDNNERIAMGRRASDAQLIGKGRPHKSDIRRADSNGILLPKPILKKDYLLDNDGAVIESSDEDNSRSSDEVGRGRAKGSRRRKSSGTAQGQAKHKSDNAEQTPDDDELTLQLSNAMLGPQISMNEVGGDKSKISKPGVHPSTAFDHVGSGFNTPMTSDTEADASDIKRAQKLAIIMTPVVSTPKTNRCVRTIYRGDFGKMQREAFDNARRVRKYLVATDLSEEAAHALEWTVGTVLRDGDTLLAIYCVDEEERIGQDLTSLKAESIGVTTRSIGPSPLGGRSSESNSVSPSPAGRERSKAEDDRFKAVEDITTRVTKLLRKTRLQVRVVIEVIHCKSPRHLITEVIDHLNPTLVILGSRGRSALKGVILGSFSNYLVTKSSVPVMVARKKLRKHSKYKRPAIKLANNLPTMIQDNGVPKTLANAKID